MMNDRGKSDASIVPKKSANKVGPNSTAAEQMEGSGATEGNEVKGNTLRTQGRASVQSELELVRERAKMDKKMRFTTLLHHIYNVDRLRRAFLKLKKDAAPGVDRETWQHYGETLEENLQDLSARLKRGGYRAKPVRRTYIPKADGRQRPLGVTAVEDKIVQGATVEVLNAIYETDFLDFSYGFRPGRSQHNALDAVYVGIDKKKVNWVLDADIRDFYNSISHGWMVKFIEHRIADRRVVRLIQKWLKAGVLEDGKVTYSEEGAPQGGSASPLLSNIFLHYAYDLWTQMWRQKQAQGEIIAVRYADDTIVGFQYKTDAERFLKELKERLQKFGLELHPEKTRLIEFGRFAARDRERRGQGKPESFTFLGFTHSCGTTRGGRFTIVRQTIKKRLRAKLQEVKTELERRMHDPIREVGKWLREVVRGHYQYYGVPMNLRALSTFRLGVVRHWMNALRRRSQKGHVTWDRMNTIISRWLPTPRNYHPYPSKRFGVMT